MSDQSPVPASGTDWTVELTNQIESVVATVRDNTTVPVTRAAEAIVFGLVGAMLGVVGVIFLVLLLQRVLMVYLPVHPLARRVWVADAITSAIFLGAGALLWRLRLAREG
jgi:hypothetical protein